MKTSRITFAEAVTRRGRVATVIAAAAGMLIAVTPMANAAPGVHISCPLNIVLDFSPPITNVSTNVTATGTGWLGDKSGSGIACTSPDGTAKDNQGAPITGSKGSTFPTKANAGGSGTASGPQTCSSSDFPNGKGEITWNDSSKIEFDWQFGVSSNPPVATFSGKVTKSTASWAFVNDTFVVVPTTFTQNGGRPPIVDCAADNVRSDEFTGVFNLKTP